MSTSLGFPKRVFQVAAIYGLLVLLPQYLVELGLGSAEPVRLARPEYFYGFVGVAVAWQLVFLLIAHDVRRYRPLMLLAVVEKLAFGLAVVPLFAAHRIAVDMLAAGLIDLALGAFFVLAYRATPSER
ncbi:MAG: hypothetical protein ACLGIK_07790 [Gemmatimonadota bacterium]